MGVSSIKKLLGLELKVTEVKLSLAPDNRQLDRAAGGAAAVQHDAWRPAMGCLCEMVTVRAGDRNLAAATLGEPPGGRQHRELQGLRHADRHRSGVSACESMPGPSGAVFKPVNLIFFQAVAGLVLFELATPAGLEPFIANELTAMTGIARGIDQNREWLAKLRIFLVLPTSQPGQPPARLATVDLEDTLGPRRSRALRAGEAGLTSPRPQPSWSSREHARY